MTATDKVEAKRPSRRLIWIIAVVAAASIAAVAVWFAAGFGDSSDSEPDGFASPSASESISEQDPKCADPADPPESGDVSIADESVDATDPDTVSFEFAVLNSSELSAVDVALTIGFLVDGSDATDEMDGAFFDSWSDATVDVEPDSQFLVSDSVSAPSGWDEAEVELEVTVDEVGQWCTPPPFEEKCGEPADPPESGGVSTVEEYVLFDEGDMAFGFHVLNSSELVAVDVALTIRFLSDGEDVTGELGEDFFDEWSDVQVGVEPDAPLVLSDVVDAPSGWEETDMEIEVEVGDAAQWCVPHSVE